MWVEQFLNWRRYRYHLATVIILAANTALFIILGFLPLMDNFYHIIAMGCGALLAPAMLRPEVREWVTLSPGCVHAGAVTCHLAACMLVCTCHTLLHCNLIQLHQHSCPCVLLTA